MTRRRDARGMSTAVEAAILIPLVVTILSVMLAGFRVWQARTDLRQTAAAAARAASLARSLDEASARVRQVVDANPGTCADPQISADLHSLAAPAGTSGEVRVTLTCTVPLADLGLPLVPGHRTVSATGVAPVDTYRQRGP